MLSFDKDIKKNSNALLDKIIVKNVKVKENGPVLVKFSYAPQAKQIIQSKARLCSLHCVTSDLWS